MRIGEVARRVGVSADTVRFYERAGWSPRPARQRGNDYRQYNERDVEHLRLLIDLRRLDIPLDEAARLAGWCHSGHCAQTSDQLPKLIDERRMEIAERVARLNELDARLAQLARHLASHSSALRVLDAGTPCCAAADAIVTAAETGCTSCVGPPQPTPNGAG
jgi:DNA-binding transcriptional MerR regulator